MANRVSLLVIAAALSGCAGTSIGLVRDLVVPECPARSTNATSQAAACLSAAGVELAMEQADPDYYTRENVEYEVARKKTMDSLAEEAAAAADDR